MQRTGPHQNPDRNDDEGDRKGCSPSDGAPVPAQHQIAEQKAGIELAHDRIGEQHAAGRVTLPLEQEHRDHRDGDDRELHVTHDERDDDRRREEREGCQPERVRPDRAVESTRNEDHTRDHHGEVEGEPDAAKAPEVTAGRCDEPRQRQEGRRVVLVNDQGPIGRPRRGAAGLTCGSE